MTLLQWFRHGPRLALALSLPLAVLASAPAPLHAQTLESEIVRVDLAVGRSYPIETTTPITRVSVANPDVAAVAVIGERDVVINARAGGETDVIMWVSGQARRHYRVSVHTASGRMQVALSVKFAEVRRDLLNQLGVSGLFRDSEGRVRVGTGIFRTDDVFDAGGNITLPGESSRFLTILGDFGTDDLLALIDAEATRGDARILAEPNVMAADREQASFLAGGELPIPVVQGGGAAGGAGPASGHDAEYQCQCAGEPAEKGCDRVHHGSGARCGHGREADPSLAAAGRH